MPITDMREGEGFGEVSFSGEDGKGHEEVHYGEKGEGG